MFVRVRRKVLLITTKKFSLKFKTKLKFYQRLAPVFCVGYKISFPFIKFEEKDFLR